MSSLDVDGLRGRLEEERVRLLNAARYLHQQHAGSMEEELGEIWGGAADNHPGDMATVTYDRELDQGLEEGVQETVMRIDAALARIANGTYGSCEVCGRPIVPGRLEAIPWATRCIDDAKR